MKPIDLVDLAEASSQGRSANDSGAAKQEKSSRALRTISEAADLIDVPQHVLRFWETKFPQIKPLKRNGGRRFYRPEDIDTLQTIKTLLYKKGFTIKGARKALENNSFDALEASVESEMVEVQETVAVIAGKPVIDDAQTVKQLEALRKTLVECKERLAAFSSNA